MGSLGSAHSPLPASHPCRRCAAAQALRLFHCWNCDGFVTVCRGCDRNQRYCSPACQTAQRTQQVHQAGYRYQQTQRGRQKHAARQRAYAARRRMQAAPQALSPSPPPPPSSCVGLATALRPQSRPAAELPTLGRQLPLSRPAPSSPLPCCFRCGRSSGGWLRRDFVRGRSRHRHR